MTLLRSALQYISKNPGESFSRAFPLADAYGEMAETKTTSKFALTSMQKSLIKSLFFFISGSDNPSGFW